LKGEGVTPEGEKKRGKELGRLQAERSKKRFSFKIGGSRRLRGDKGF